MADSIVTTKQGQFADLRRDFMVDGEIVMTTSSVWKLLGQD